MNVEDGQLTWLKTIQEWSQFSKSLSQSFAKEISKLSLVVNGAMKEAGSSQ